jgi:RNA polymerase sigma-70 factor, ECF subfamily
LEQSTDDVSGGKVVPQRILPIHMTDSEVNDLFALCLPRLTKAARRMLRNQQDSEDALQDGLLLAFRKLQQFQGRSAFSTWLHSIVRNTSRMHYRKAAEHPVASIELAMAEERPFLPESSFVATGPSPEEICIQHERSNILLRTTRELPSRYHKAIRHFYLEGLSEEETAEKLGMTRGALKSQLHRSRRILTCRIWAIYMPESRGCRFKANAKSRQSAPRAGRRKNQSIATNSTEEASML